LVLLLLALTCAAGAMAPCPLIKRTRTVTATHDGQVSPPDHPADIRFTTAPSMPYSSDIIYFLGFGDR
jgi:hypothetical protein